MAKQSSHLFRIYFPLERGPAAIQEGRGLCLSDKGNLYLWNLEVFHRPQGGLMVAVLAEKSESSMSRYFCLTYKLRILSESCRVWSSGPSARPFVCSLLNPPSPLHGSGRSLEWEEVCGDRKTLRERRKCTACDPRLKPPSTRTRCGSGSFSSCLLLLVLASVGNQRFFVVT